MGMSSPCTCGRPTAQQRRLGGALPAAGPQHLGPGRQTVQGAGALQLRPRGRQQPRRAGAPGRLGLPVPGPRPGAGRHRRRGAGVRRGAPARRGLGAGRPVAPPWHGPDDAAAAQGPAAGPHRRAGAVRAGRQPGAGAVLEAGRRRLGQRRRGHRGLERTSDDACYRAMDWLLEIHRELEREVFGQVATLLDLEVDLLFFDTTSTYFEPDEPDEPIARDQRGHVLPKPSDPAAGDGDGAKPAGFRTYGKSKDHRDDLPQVVVGMAVTRTGIPVRVRCWPGNTRDQVLVRQVKADLRAWTLTRVIWVAGRGFA